MTNLKQLNKNRLKPAQNNKSASKSSNKRKQDGSEEFLNEDMPSISSRLRQIMVSSGYVAYEWSVKDDTLCWSGDITRILGISDETLVSTGRGYASFMDPGNKTSRYDAVVKNNRIDEGAGVPFQAEYGFMPAGRDSSEILRIEDSGRWYAGLDGLAVRAVGMVRIVNERYERDQRLTYLSKYDELTGYMNRAKLTKSIEEVLKPSGLQRSSSALILAGIDNLSLINNAFGYDVGDSVIASTARRLKKHLRNRDSIGRYAGNKFGIVLRNCTAHNLELVVARMMSCVRESVIDTQSGPVSVTTSMGGVMMPRHAKSVREAMNYAEAALNQAKQGRVDNFVVFKPSAKLDLFHKRNIQFADNIIAALNNRSMMPAFQPVVCAKTLKPAFYESLLRLKNPDGEIVSGGPLIPLAEQLGLVRLIDHRMLELVTIALEKDPDLRLSLNVSGLTSSCSSWMTAFSSRVGSNPDLAKRLIIEITETAALQNIEETNGFLSTVRGAGCKVAIDDFGAGYTSFHNLKHLDVDMVKLDGGFIVNIHNSQDDQFFARTLIDLAKNFELETVAEWVQDEPTADMLREWGVDYLQGYLYGKPFLPEEFEDGAESSASG